MVDNVIRIDGRPYWSDRRLQRSRGHIGSEHLEAREGPRSAYSLAVALAAEVTVGIEVLPAPKAVSGR